MTDILSPAERSERMSRVRAKHTSPEMTVRRLVHRMGYRYRLHSRDLPGKPDLVFRSRRAVIFVHGCFWHMHSDSGCKLSKLPKSRTEYWLPKLLRNAERDVRNRQHLEKEGWKVLELWECQLGRPADAEEVLRKFLD